MIGWRALSSRSVTLAAISIFSSCTGAIQSAGDDSPPDPRSGRGGQGGSAAAAAALPGPELAPTSRLRRLTVAEYDDTVQQLLGQAPNAAQVLADEGRTPFDNDYTAQVVSESLIRGAEQLAGDAVASLLANKARRDRIVGRDGSGGCVARGVADADCLREFVTRFGRLAWRRALTNDDIQDLTAIGQALAKQDTDFYSGVDAVIRALLQDAEFLFRVEVGTPAGSGLFKLTSPEMATRLSYFLWGQAPDAWLLDRAESGAGGGLDTPDRVRAVATEMLTRPAAQARIARFHALWLGYEQLTASSPVSRAMKQETERLVARVIFERKGAWQDVLRSEETYVTYDLARYYGMTIPPGSGLKPGATTAAWLPYTGTKRQGLLSHGTFLSLAQTPDENKMTVRRGKAIRELLFCRSLPPKPAMLPDIPVTPRTPCKRDVLEAKTAPPACATCHLLMNPVGFGLDRYDSAGATREYYPDPTTGKASTRCPISGQGELDGQPFSGPGELANLVLARPDEMNACALRRIYQFAMGVGDGNDPATHEPKLGETDLQFLELMAKRLGASDFNLDQVLLDFVSSGAFAHRRAGR